MRNVIRIIMIALLSAGVIVPGCAKKKTRSVTVEGPENKYEVKLEKTDKKPDDDD